MIDGRSLAILRDLQSKRSRVFDRYPALRAGNLRPQMDLSDPLGATLSGIDISDPIAMADARNVIRTIVFNALNAAARSAPRSGAVLAEDGPQRQPRRDR
jgi:hypothetical protein